MRTSPAEARTTNLSDGLKPALRTTITVNLRSFGAEVKNNPARCRSTMIMSKQSRSASFAGRRADPEEAAKGVVDRVLREVAAARDGQSAGEELRAARVVQFFEFLPQGSGSFR